MALLVAEKLAAGFGDRTVIRQLSLAVEQGMMLSIIGPNGSGKSTLLKILARNMKPLAGSVLLNGDDIQGYSAKKFARQLAILQQGSRSPNDLTVQELVEYGRFPHQKWWGGVEAEDRRVLEWALQQMKLSSVAARQVSTLSGGERQRAWIAMALAQKPRVLLLDEPTTHLDICHQLEIMELLQRLNKEQRITIVMVLHDMNCAARYSDTVAVLAQGKLYAAGRPEAVITPRMLREVFGVEADIWPDSQGRPVCLPRQLATPI